MCFACEVVELANSELAKLETEAELVQDYVCKHSHHLPVMGSIKVCSYAHISPFTSDKKHCDVITYCNHLVFLLKMT